jgi:transposase-like protein
MAMNRVQFQKGLSMSAFQSRYGTEAACEAAVLAARWPHGFACPHCESTRCSRFERNGRAYWQCTGCRHQYSLLAGTVFDNTKLPLTQWFQALYVLTQNKNNVSALELMRHLGVCYRTAWRMKHKLMQAMIHRDAARQLSGFVQIDDAYLGGVPKRDKSVTAASASAGRKTSARFWSLATDAAGHPQMAIAEPVEGFTKAALTEWIIRRLHPDAEVFSAMDWVPSAPRVSSIMRIRLWRRRTAPARAAKRKALDGSISSWETSSDPWMAPIMRSPSSNTPSATCPRLRGVSIGASIWPPWFPVYS